MSVADPFAVESRENPGIAAVMARRGVDHAVIGAALGASLPDGPACVRVGNVTCVGTGPGNWLVVQSEAAPDFAENLAARLEGLASVSDQSSGYHILRLTGAGARTILQRGAAIDFHPDRFQSGSAATTVIAHIGVIIWQVDDQPSYDLAIFRSYAGSFHHWLDLTAKTL